MIELAVGDRIRMRGGGFENRSWTVKAADERFAVLSRGGTYTIIDWERGVRGPCNLSGQGWEMGKPGWAEDLLRALNYHLEVEARLLAGEKSVALEEVAVEVSYRNNVPVEILEVSDGR